MSKTLSVVAVASLLLGAVVLASRPATAEAHKDCETLFKEADELMGIAIKSVRENKKAQALSSAAGANKRFLDAYFECLPDAAKVKRAHQGVVGAHEAFVMAHRLPSLAPNP